MKFAASYKQDKFRKEVEGILVEANTVVALEDTVVVKGVAATDGISLKYEQIEALAIDGEAVEAPINQKALLDLMLPAAEEEEVVTPST